MRRLSIAFQPYIIIHFLFASLKILTVLILKMLTEALLSIHLSVIGQNRRYRRYRAFEAGYWNEFQT